MPIKKALDIIVKRNIFLFKMLKWVCFVLRASISTWTSVIGINIKAPEIIDED